MSTEESRKKRLNYRTVLRTRCLHQDTSCGRVQKGYLLGYVRVGGPPSGSIYEYSARCRLENGGFEETSDVCRSSLGTEIWFASTPATDYNGL